MQGEARLLSGSSEDTLRFPSELASREFTEKLGRQEQTRYRAVPENTARPGLPGTVRGQRQMAVCWT